MAAAITVTERHGKSCTPEAVSQPAGFASSLCRAGCWDGEGTGARQGAPSDTGRGGLTEETTCEREVAKHRSRGGDPTDT